MTSFFNHINWDQKYNQRYYTFARPITIERKMSTTGPYSLPARVIEFIVQTCKNHKKKLIALVLLAIGVKWCSKNLNIHHLIYMVQKISYLISLLSYLPLPQAPSYRQVGVYKHQPSAKVLPLYELMDVVNLSEKVKAKQQGSWNNLKISVFTGVIMNLVFYDIRPFFKTVESKYIQDFKLLKKEVYFNLFLQQLNKKFMNSLAINFEVLKDYLNSMIAQVNLKQILNFQQIEKLLKSMVKKVFELKYDYYEQIHEKLWKLSTKDKVSNMFYTPYRLAKQDPRFQNKIYKVGSGFFSLVKGVILFPTKIFSLLPQPKQQITSERFQCCKILYGLPIKKANQFAFQSDDEYRQIIAKSEARIDSVQSADDEGERTGYKICKMILSQIEQTIQSVNFQTLVYHYANLNLKIFMNRLKMYMKLKRIVNIRVSDFLPVAYKIVKQQIQTNKQKRDEFYQHEIIKALRTVKSEQNSTMSIHENDVNQDDETLQMRNTILDQIFSNNQFGYLQRQFELKYFHQRSKLVVSPSRSKKPKEEDEQMQQMLNMLSREQ